VAFAVWAVATAAWVLARRNARNLVSLGVLALPIFVAWKHGMVRQDIHTYFLAWFGMLVVLILLADTLGATRRLADALVAGGLIGLLLFVPCNEYAPQCGLPWLRSIGTSLAERSGRADLQRAASFEAYRAGVARQTQATLSPMRLPPGLRSLI